MYKLIAIDLDGTLLNKNGEISPANKQAIKIAIGKIIPPPRKVIDVWDERLFGLSIML